MSLAIIADPSTKVELKNAVVPGEKPGAEAGNPQKPKVIYNKIATGNLSADLEGYAYTRIKTGEGQQRGVLFYVSMYGREAEVKAVWATLLTYPPLPVTLYRVLADGFTEDVSVPRIQLFGADRSQSGGWYLEKKNTGKAHHYVMVPNVAFADLDYSRGAQELTARPADNFLILIKDLREAAPVEQLYYDRLNNPKNPLVSTPLKPEWAGWLWSRARYECGEVKKILSNGLAAAYLCKKPDEALLETDLSRTLAEDWQALLYLDEEVLEQAQDAA